MCVGEGVMRRVRGGEREREACVASTAHAFTVCNSVVSLYAVASSRNLEAHDSVQFIVDFICTALFLLDILCAVKNIHVYNLWNSQFSRVMFRIM